MTFGPVDLDAVARFAGQFGLPARPARDGSFSFAFAQDGVLTLTPPDGRGRACLSLARRLDRPEPGMARAALLQAGFDPSLDRVIHVCLTGDNQLSFTLALEAGRLSLPDLENGLQALMGKMQAVM